METNLPATQETNLPATSSAMEGIDTSDMIIPRILMMQGLSEQVADGNASMGDFVSSTDGVKLGGKDKPVEFIPLKMYKTLLVKDVSGSKPQFIRSLPWGPEAEELSRRFEEIVDGKKLRYDRALNCYVVLTDDIKNGIVFPYLISFQRTSYMAGRKMATHFAKSAGAGKPALAFVLALTCSIRKNEQGTFYVADVAFRRRADSDEIETASKWLATVNSKDAPRVDEEKAAPQDFNCMPPEPTPENLDY